MVLEEVGVNSPAGRHRPQYAWILAALLGAAGCAAQPRYALEIARLHKDAALVIVRVPTRLDPKAYRAIVDAEIPHVLASDKLERPVWELRFEFVAPSAEGPGEEKVASYVWSRALGALDARHAEPLVLY
jgi:hypothetical protein